jgi:hypothetical protein
MSEKLCGADALDTTSDLEDALKKRGFAAYTVFWRGSVR